MPETIYWDALQDVKDPEIPTVSVIEMGMVNRITREEKQISVEMTPTFMGCPALDMIRTNIITRLMEEEGVENVTVRFVHHPPWTSSRITPEGQRKLKEFGIAPPNLGEELFVPSCPYCGSDGGTVDNLFGPTACRAIFYCRSCRQPFEGMKVV